MNDKMLERTIEYLAYTHGYQEVVIRLAESLIQVDPPRGVRFLDAIQSIALPGGTGTVYELTSLLHDYIVEFSFVRVLRATYKVYFRKLAPGYAIPFAAAIVDFLPNR